MGIIGFLVFGLIVGAVARLLLPGRQKIGLLWTLGIGAIGSIVGGVIANAIGSGSIGELNIFGSIVAVVVAIAALSAAETMGIGAGDKKRSLER